MKQTSHTHYCSSVAFVEWVELAAPGLVSSRVTLWVDAFVVQLINYGVNRKFVHAQLG